ncbi:MAG TPA: DUF2339 domain-containing protein [Allosphingosinicella sp.]|jgi:uncharacterized membrane protein|uniref:DUF2339 domain-containing protein n=1 Tax=Allosphingosinicella sp. TaxID=2823234 RepID=UPI002F2A6604
MLEVLVFAAVFIAIAQLWSRMAQLEQRLNEVQAAASVPGFAMPEAPMQRVAAGLDTGRPAEAHPVRLDFEPEAPHPEVAAAPEPAPQSVVPEVPHWIPDPAPAQQTDLNDPEPQERASSFEELFGRKLPIWAGGVTLAVAGVLIVRYSIEAGLLSPLIRFLSGLMFGAALIGAAETALRMEVRVRDPRVRQSLAGAGIASLYASILVAVNVYALIGPLPAFIGMAAVTALAMALSLRFGAPSAMLGLVGGLAAPALVGTGEPNVPLLTLYLALAVGGLSALSRAQRWTWLGISALVGGLGWGAVLLLGGALDTASTLSIGFYVIAVGIAFPLVALPSGGAAIIRVIGSVAAAAQMAALVATGGFALLHWSLFGLISIAILWLSRREEGFRHLPAVGLGIALLLLGAWTNPAPAHFAMILVATGAIYGGPLLLRLWRPTGGLPEAIQIAGLAMAATLLPSLHFYRADGSVDLALGLVALSAAGLPAIAALLGWTKPERRSDARFALLSTATGLLITIASAFVAPSWLLPLLVGGVAVMLLLLSLRAEDERVEWSGWVFAAASVPLLAAAPLYGAEVHRLFGLPEQVPLVHAFLRWAGLACVAAAFAWNARLDGARAAAQSAAALVAYGAMAQIAPLSVLPLVPGAGLLALAAASRRLAPGTLLPAMAALLGVSAAWAGLPMLHWSESAIPALGGDPVLVGELPIVRDVLLRLLLPSALIGGALWMGTSQICIRARKIAFGFAALLGAIGLHILFKQLFSIGFDDQFIRLGFAERTVWEALLVVAGVAAWKLGSRPAALALCAAGLAHFGVFTVLLHNPLWANQAVGTVPIFNLLLPGYGLALALLWAGRRFEPELSSRFERPRALLQMLLILLLAFSSLRHWAEGTVLSGWELSAGENIARSILAVLLAIGFLLWGIRSGARDWRIASLVLMLAAVAKVFLLDASGLEGLMRIASFVALGLSLIGIGWLYSRSLGGVRPSSSLR